MASGESQWITGPEARKDVQYWRARSDAIVTGIGTVLKDDPALTVRDRHLAPYDQPLRVVMDHQLRTPPSAKVVEDEHATLLVHDPSTDIPQALMDRSGVSFFALAQGEGLDALLRHLAESGCNEVLVEAGAGVVGSFVSSNAWDEWISYLAPKWLGGNSQRVVGFDPTFLANAPTGQIVGTRQFGDDVRLTIRANRE